MSELHDGIKLRNVVRAVRMKQVDRIEADRKASKLIIQR